MQCKCGSCGEFKADNNNVSSSWLKSLSAGCDRVTVFFIFFGSLVETTISSQLSSVACLQKVVTQPTPFIYASNLHCFRKLASGSNMKRCFIIVWVMLLKMFPCFSPWQSTLEVDYISCVQITVWFYMLILAAYSSRLLKVYWVKSVLYNTAIHRKRICQFSRHHKHVIK